MEQIKRKAKIYKNGIEVGWAKADYSAIANVVNTCDQHGFDITTYEVRDYETNEVIWKGSEYTKT